MTALFQMALGDRFGFLHPRLQEYYGLQPGSGQYLVAEGVFDVAGSPLPWLRPALKLAADDEAFFGEYGTDVPFTAEMHAHEDPFHRPSLTTVRYLGFDGANRTLRDTVSGSDNGLVDYLGSSHRIATGIRPMLGPEGSFRSVSARTRFFLPGNRPVLRMPSGLDARTYTWQRFDDDSEEFHLQVRVVNRLFGTLFHYAGRLTARLVDYPSHEAASHGVPNVLPELAAPKRWEAHA